MSKPDDMSQPAGCESTRGMRVNPRIPCECRAMQINPMQLLAMQINLMLAIQRNSSIIMTINPV